MGSELLGLLGDATVLPGAIDENLLVDDPVDPPTNPAAPALYGTQDVDAEAAAKTRQLSNITGMPESILDGNEDTVQNSVDLNTANDSLEEAPATSLFLSGRNARVVNSRDVPVLAAIEQGFKDYATGLQELPGAASKALGVADDLGRSFAVGPTQAIGGGVKGIGLAMNSASNYVGDLALQGMRAAGLGDLASAVESVRIPWYLTVGGILQGAGNPIQKDLAEIIRIPQERQNLATQVAEGGGQLAAQVAVAIYAPWASGSMLFGQGVNIIGQDMERQGLDADGGENTAALLTGGLVTAGTEAIALNKIINKLPGVKSFVGRVVSGATVEFTQEWSEKVMHNLTALAFYDPNRDKYDGAFDEATPAGILGAIVGAITPRRMSIKAKEQADRVQALIANSELTERLPEAAIDHVEMVLEDAATGDVYIKAEQLVESLGEGQQIVPKDKVDEALVLGGDVKLSNRQLAEIMADTQKYDVVGDHLRYGLDNPTAAETATQTDDQASMEAINSALVHQEILADETLSDAEKAVEVAEEAAGLNALFLDAQESGMTPKQYEAYLLALARSHETSVQREEKKRVRVETKLASKQMEEARVIEREQTQEHILQEVPVYGALSSLGVERIDRQAIIDLLPDGQGEALLEQLPKIDGRTPYAPKGEQGIDPEVLAEKYGFESADLMLFEMANAKPFDQAVDEMTEVRLRENNPALAEEMDALDNAREALHHDNQEDLLGYELAVLRQARGAGAISMPLIRQSAKESFDKTPVSDINPKQFEAAGKRAAREARRLLRNGDRDGAARAKFQQLLNVIMERQAYAARAKIKKQNSEINKYNNPKATFPSIDADYVAQIQHELAVVNLGAQVSDARRASLMEFAQKKAQEDGAIFQTPPEIVATDERVQHGDMTVGEWDAFYGVIKNIEAQGRLKKQIGDAGKKRDFKETKDVLLHSANQLDTTGREERSVKDQNPGWWDKRLGGIAALDATVRKVEFLLSKLDGGKMVGAWHEAIFQRIADSQTNELDFKAKNIKPLMEALEKLPTSRRKIRVESLQRNFKKSDILMMALNVGNESNYNKMLEGSEKDNAAVKWTPAGIDEALEHLNAEEAAWVQSVWDMHKTHYPQVEAIYKEEFGQPPVAITPRKVTIGGMELEGGYMPMMYDSRRGTKEQRREEKDAGTAIDGMQDPAVQASVFSGMSKARAEGYSAPVQLDISKLDASFSRLSHYITHYNSVRDVRKIIDNAELQTAINQKLGREYHAELSAWLDAVAEDGMQVSDLKAWDNVIGFARRGVTASVLGASYTTMVAQTFGLASSVAVLGKATQGGGGFSGLTGADWMAVGMEQYIQNPVAASRMAFELSGEMRHRLKNVDREVSQALNSKAGLIPILQQQQQAALMMVGGMQMFTVDMPTWLAGYNMGIEQGMTQEKSVQLADSVVRTSQASGHVKDLSAIQRTKGFLRAATMFSSYLMVSYNIQAETLSDAKKLKNLPGAVSRYGWLIVLPAMADALLRQEGPDEDDEQSTGAWAGLKTFGYAVSAVPLAGPALSSMISGFKPDLTALNSIGNTTYRALNSVAKSIEEGEADDDLARNLIVAAGTAIGFGGTSQVKRFLDAQAAEEDQDVGMYDYFIGPKKK